VAIEDSEFTIELDTLIVAISEDSGVDCITPAREGGVEVTDWNTVKADSSTLATSRPGVFAAGDVISGPNTIIDAIADGKRSAIMIDHFIQGRELTPPAKSTKPLTYLEQPEIADQAQEAGRVETPRASVEWRKRNFAEVEVGLSVSEARCEAGRCLRCDLEFAETGTREPLAVGGHSE
jgi:NADPH-dependent glutamate synthase beta subunit-like oxidoreductase